MKKYILLILLLLGLSGSIIGCSSDKELDSNKNITKYSRDTESGTRDGFFTAIGYKEAINDDEKIPGFVKATDNGTMISSIKNDEYGIGYISLTSLAQSDLKGLKFDGVEPTEANVVNGTYKLSRNFNYIVRQDSDLTEDEKKVIDAFRLFMQSQEGMAAIQNQGGILMNDISAAKSFSELLDENPTLKDFCNKEKDTITINFGGSTSVEKVAKELTKTFGTYCKGFKAVHNHKGSSEAFKCTQGSEKDSANKLHVGFLSRELKADSEKQAENTSGLLCKDGIVVVVNKKNNFVDNVTAEQLKEIYSQTGLKWSYFSK